MLFTESGLLEKWFGILCVALGVLVFFTKPPKGQAPLRRRLEFLFFMTTFGMFLWEVPLSIKAYGFGMFALWDLLRVECVNGNPATTRAKVGQFALHIFLFGLLCLGAYCVLGDLEFPKSNIKTNTTT
jgi:hypothetical protein